MTRILMILSALALTVFSCTTAQQVNTENLKKHITYLADDKLEGRATSEAGADKAAEYISDQFKSLKLEPKGNNGTFIQTYPYRESIDPHGSVDTTLPPKIGKNVVGFLDNKAATTIVIGGHYDHLGLGNHGGSLDPNPKGKIHNGADDNASGSAGVIELARYYQQNSVKEPFNFLFICFSGEELGLLGSKGFTNNPTIDLSTVNIMFNMDMIGRLDSANHLMLFGVGTSPVLSRLVMNTNKTFQIKMDSSGVGPSDQTSFYLKNIPVLHFFTGAHSDYHKPSDDADKINFAGEKIVLEYLIRLVDSIGVQPRLVFTATRNSNAGDSPRFKVTMGVLPDYSYSGGGLKIDGVTEGKPAHGAGILQGDVVIKLGEYPITDIQSYMKALGKFNKTDSTTVTVKRGEQTIELKITF